MANRIPKLTKRAVDALKPNGGDMVYWDSELTGFGLRVRKSGRKNYVVQTRVAGRLRWFTIGPHGPLTPDEARSQALDILALAKKGIDPRGGHVVPRAGPSHGLRGQAATEPLVHFYAATPVRSYAAVDRYFHSGGFLAHRSDRREQR